MKKPHVMHVTDSLAIGGKERMLVGLASELASVGTNVSVCVTRSDLTLAGELQVDIPVLALHRQWPFDIAGFRRFLAYVDEQQPDIFHAHGRSSLSFLVFLRTIRKISAPILFHDHYGLIESDQVVPGWFRWWGYRLVDYYVGVYAKLADWALAARIPRQKIVVIENGINTRPYLEPCAWDLHAKYHLPKDKKIGVMVGGLRREKGLDLLSQAVSQAKLAADIHIFVVGSRQDGKYVETCLHEMDVRDIAERFTFLGEQLEVPAILKGADFALMPSRSESGPLVLIEYLAAALPIVAFRVGAISQAACEYGVPGFVQPNDVKLFANELDHLLMMPTDQRVQRGLYGQKIAREKFDIARRVPEWCAVYEEILQRAARAR